MGHHKLRFDRDLVQQARDKNKPMYNNSGEQYPMTHSWLPEIGFGASALAGMYKPVSEKEARLVLETAWAQGIRYYDTAPHYGQGRAERRLGDFLREKNTDEYVLSTKVGRLLTASPAHQGSLNGFMDPLPFSQHFDYSYNGVMRSVEDSLQRLGLNSIDILYVHDIGKMTHGHQSGNHLNDLRNSGFKALNQLKEQNIVRAIGLGVNEVEVCEVLIKTHPMDLILLAGRYTLLDQSAFPNLANLCKEHAVSLVIGGIFNSGILGTGPVEGARYDYEPASQEMLDRVRQIQTICQKHKVDLPAAALQFPALSKSVKSVLIGTSKCSSLTRNMALYKRSLPNELWSELLRAGLIKANLT